MGIGETMAVLKAEGTIPVDNDEWIMAVIKEINEERHDFTRVVGNGSRAHEEGLDLRMRSDI